MLYETSPRGVQQVARVSAAAAKLGVQPGMSVSDARARWPGQLSWEKTDSAGDRDQLLRLARRLGRFSPVAGLEDADQPESILLDISGIAALFGGEQALADAALQAVTAERLTCRGAIADTVGMAWGAAHFIADASGPFVIPAGESRAFLAPLSVATLRLSPSALEALSEFGLTAIGDLLAVPRSAMAGRLDPEVLLRLSQTLGELAEPVVGVEPEEAFVAAWDFEQAIERTDIIEAALRRLCELLADDLNRSRRGASRLCCTLRCEASASVALSVGFFEPTANADHFLELLHLRLENQRLPAAVTGIRLEADGVCPLASRQRELFPEIDRAEERQFALLVDRLCGRLGGQAVVSPVPRAEAQPELAWREEPLLEAGAKNHGRRRKIPASPRWGLLERPLFLFRPPAPIEVTAVAPDGPPARFVWDGRSYSIARQVGPERIETGWWRRRGVRRDYYRVETDQGERFWLFRSLPKGRWYLHGEFA